MADSNDLSTADLAKFSMLFGALDEADRKKLVALSTRKRHAAGSVICREGDDGTEFFVVAQGKVKVVADDFGNEKLLDTLGPGQFFGELALLSGKKRQATVTALETVELISFPKSAVEQVLQHSPRAKEMLQKVGLHRTEDAMQKMME